MQKKSNKMQMEKILSAFPPDSGPQLFIPNAFKIKAAELF